MSRKSLIPVALAALLATAPAMAQSTSGGTSGTSGSDSSSTAGQSGSTDTSSTTTDSAASDSATTSSPTTGSATTNSATSGSGAQETATPGSTTSGSTASGSAQNPSASSGSTTSGSPQTRSSTQRGAAGRAAGQTGASGQAGAQGDTSSDAADDTPSSTPRASSRSGSQRGSQSGARSAESATDDPSLGTGVESSADADLGTGVQSSDDTDLGTGVESSEDSDLGTGIESSTDADAQTDADSNAEARSQGAADVDAAQPGQESEFSTRPGQREMRNRRPLDNNQADETDSQDDLDVPARPENEDIPGRATGRPDNDELPGRAFNNSDDDATQDAQQRSQSRRSRTQNNQSQDDQSQDDQAQDDQDQFGADADASADANADLRTQRRDARQQNRQSREDRMDRDQQRQLGNRSTRTQRSTRIGAEGELNADVDVAQRLGVQLNPSRNGLAISSLTQSSILAEAGIRRGDILMSVDGQRITTADQLNQLLVDVDAGQRVPFTVLRNGRQQQIYLTGDQLVGAWGSSQISFWERAGLNLATNAGRLVIDSVGADGYFVDYGFQPGDVIVSAYGQPVRSTQAFQSIILDADPGTRIPVAVLRDGTRETIYITARQEMLDSFNSVARAEYGSTSSGGRGAWLGVTLDPRYTSGARVRTVQQGSPAQQAGVRAGDLILSVNGSEIESPDHLSQMISQMDPQESIDLEVSRRARMRLEADLEAQPRSYVGERYEEVQESDSQYQSDSETIDYGTQNQYRGPNVDTFENNYPTNTRSRAAMRRSTDGYENRTDDRGAFEAGDGDGRLLNRDEGGGGIRGRIFGGNR